MRSAKRLLLVVVVTVLLGKTVYGFPDALSTVSYGGKLVSALVLGIGAASSLDTAHQAIKEKFFRSGIWSIACSGGENLNLFEFIAYSFHSLTVMRAGIGLAFAHGTISLLSNVTMELKPLEQSLRCGAIGSLAILSICPLCNIAGFAQKLHEHNQQEISNVHRAKWQLERHIAFNSAILAACGLAVLKFMNDYINAFVH